MLTITAITKRLLISTLVSFCSLVWSCSMLCSEVPILPNSVWIPVAVTLPTPFPRTISVPLNTRPTLSTESGSPAFATGTDSPVSMASSTVRFTASTRSASAAIRSPSCKTIMSSGTTSRPLILVSTPFRMTRALGDDSCFNASKADSVF